MRFSVAGTGSPVIRERLLIAEPPSGRLRSSSARLQPAPPAAPSNVARPCSRGRPIRDPISKLGAKSYTDQSRKAMLPSISSSGFASRKVASPRSQSAYSSSTSSNCPEASSRNSLGDFISDSSSTDLRWNFLSRLSLTITSHPRDDSKSSSIASSSSDLTAPVRDTAQRHRRSRSN